VVGRHTAGVALRSDGVQGSAVRARDKGGNKQSSQNLYLHYVQGDHLVKARSSGDGARDLGDVLGGKGDKGVFVLTSVGPGTSSWRRSERAGRGVTGLRRCNGIRGGDWGRPGSLTRGTNGPETGDERDGLVRSLGERTGRMSGMTWFAH
jgi:hypothetical protein